MTARARTVTILFTDLVGSTELLQRAGDEAAQRIFKAHHRLLREAVEAHDGHEVKWLGDGLMVAFDSTANAVDCAVAMQQSFRRPTAGERLEVRAGINVGEVQVEDGDYFGTPVVIARRLCDTAGSGQIFATDLVARLLDGRGGDIRTSDLGLMQLKGITDPVAAVEILYQHDPMALLRTLPFVGRQPEYDAMVRKLDAARTGRGSVILLAGEPGIGKTRLTEEFCEHASGVTVIRGNCYESDVAAPFGPWIEALRSLIEQTPGDSLAQTLGPGATDIAVILPEIRRRLSNLEEAPRLDPESERARLFESIVVFLRNATQSRPLVTFLDDLHWCDKPSLLLLEQVARNAAGMRIVIVGTYRDVEVDRVHPLAQTLAALRRMDHHERIAVRGFPIESVYELLSAIEPAAEAEPIKRALAAILHTEAEGNPFFIREVLNNLVESGKLVQQGGIWTGTATSIDDLGIPEGVKEVTGRRLSRLSDVCNRMLQRVSAMATGFTWDELRAICDEPEDALLNALDEALGAQLIAERSPNTYVFTHALIRATLYDELSTPRKVMLHRRTAEALESLYADDVDPHLGELAAHYVASMGGEAKKAIEYSIRAGDRAAGLMAWEEAATHYQRALDAMVIANAPQDERRCRVLLSLAECHRFTDGAAESITLVRQAVEIARRRRSPELLAQAALTFDFAAYLLPEDLSVERLNMIDEALAMVGDAEAPQRVHLLCRRVLAAAAVASARTGSRAAGFLAYAGHKEPHVLEQAREALALAERLGDASATWTASLTLHNYSWTPDNVEERRDLIDRGYAAATRGGLKVVAWERSMVQLELGDIAGFRQTAVDYDEYLQRSRYRPAAFIPQAMAVAIEAAEGNLTTAEERWSEYAAKHAGLGDVASASVAQLVLLRWMQGRLGEVEPLWNSVLTQFPGVPVYAAAFALIQAHNGKPNEAMRQIDRVVADDLRNIPRDFLWKAAVCVLADACADTQHRPAAETLYRALLPFARDNAAINYLVPLGAIARSLGRLAALLARWGEAEEHFETALEANDRMGFHAWTAWTQLNYGSMLVQRARPGDHARAAVLLSTALAFASDAGMRTVQVDSEHLLATASV
jgi:class 3 adenylate cyclase/tetratricopeptide (TPR) repeat protein